MINKDIVCLLSIKVKQSTLKYKKTREYYISLVLDYKLISFLPDILKNNSSEIIDVAVSIVENTAALL